MTHNQSIQILDIQEIKGFSCSDPEGIVVIMPCIETETGQNTAEILLRRAGMTCKILVVLDSLRQGFIKTLNQTAARVSVKYIVYLAQDAYPGRGWLKCAYDSLENSGKGLLAFNDGKWQGRIASFGMIRSKWVLSLYNNGCLFYPGYISHAADNELTVIARAQGMHVYNPECTLVEFDPDKDFGGSNPVDNALFKKRFLQGFDRLLPLDRLEPLAREYKVKWRPAVSLLVSACRDPKQLNPLLDSFFRTNLQHPLELMIIDQGCKDQAEKIRARYASQALARLVVASPQKPWASTLSWAVDKSRRNYLFIVQNMNSCKPGAMSEALDRLADQEVCAVGICQDIKNAKSGRDIDILVCRKQDVQQTGGFDSAAAEDYIGQLLQAMAAASGRDQLCLQSAASSKQEQRSITVDSWA